MTYKAHLPTGGAASPIIAYYSFKEMFDEIDHLARSRDVTMTCYVDDMALSGPRASKGLLREIQQIISKHGLKSHKAHKFSASEPKVVTGVCITVDGPRVPNKLHLKIKNGFESLSIAETPSAKVRALAPLIGRMEAAGQIDPAFKARAKTLRDQQAQAVRIHINKPNSDLIEACIIQWTPIHGLAGSPTLLPVPCRDQTTAYGQPRGKV